ncbi:MAG: hypothetical protein JWN26_407 [Candidatus Saccharibacteria bacterium]|nr:hypothetical protein [Candidatus Saccharibacteria bacterium]
MPIRSALTKGQKDAVQSTEGATALVMSLNKEVHQMEHEVSAQKITIKHTQDELEEWRERYHESDKRNGILNSKLSFFTGVEILKYIISAVGTGYGVNLLSSNNFNGTYWIMCSVILYIIITVWQKRH